MGVEGSGKTKWLPFEECEQQHKEDSDEDQDKSKPDGDDCKQEDPEDSWANEDEEDDDEWARGDEAWNNRRRLLQRLRISEEN